jgi:hypothetical protein
MLEVIVAVSLTGLSKSDNIFGKPSAHIQDVLFGNEMKSVKF